MHPTVHRTRTHKHPPDRPPVRPHNRTNKSMDTHFDVGVLRTSLLNAAVAGDTLEGVVNGGILPVDPLRELWRDDEDELKELKELFRDPAL